MLYPFLDFNYLCFFPLPVYVVTKLDIYRFLSQGTIDTQIYDSRLAALTKT
jgi:hypothetical protein